MTSRSSNTRSNPSVDDGSAGPLRKRRCIEVTPGANGSNLSQYYVGPPLTFSIGGRIFRVPVNVLREGVYFDEVLKKLNLEGGNEGISNDNPIALDAELNVTATEMESFLGVILSRNVFGVPDFEYKEWLAALELASKWSFERVKAFCLHNMDAAVASVDDAFEIIRVADKYEVKKWLPIAFKKLCERTTTLTADEGTKLGPRRTTAICRVREQRLNPSFRCGRCAACKSSHPSPAIPAQSRGTTRKAPSLSSLLHSDTGISFSFGTSSSNSGSLFSFGSAPARRDPPACAKDVTELLLEEKDLQEVGL